MRSLQGLGGLQKFRHLAGLRALSRLGVHERGPWSHRVDSCSSADCRLTLLPSLPSLSGTPLGKQELQGSY